MPVKYFYNKGDSPWQQKDAPLPVRELIAAYQNGLAGCWYDGESHERFRAEAMASGGFADFADAATAAGFADSFAGQLVLPWIWAVELFPGCWPGPPQERGDCVSHSLRTGCFGTMVGEIMGGKPDEVTGLPEGVPDVTETAVKNLVLSCEYNWWLRGYSGDGWYIDAALSTAFKSGTMLRQPYPDLGIDLTEYSYANTAKYGRSSPPDKITAVGRLHLVTTAADANSFAEIRDGLGNGHGCSSDGGEGWSSRRDANGYSPRSGSWSHSFPFIGADDRPVVHKLYGEGMILMMNNWGTWNSGPRDIIESAALVPADKKELWIKLDIVNPATGNIMIPPGSWWAKASSARNRDTKLIAGYRGWAKKSLPSLGAAGVV